VGAAKAWTTGEVVAVGNVRTANSAIWQCVQAGTTAAAGTGPTGLPTTSPSTVHTTQVTDNGAKWVFAMPAFVGFLQDSYCHTFEMIDCGTLQGLYGFSMEDSANTGTSYPQFARARNLQVDHPLSRGVRLAAGGAARFAATFVTSVYGGTGIEVGSSFKGNWEFVGGEVFGCSEAGVVVSKGDGVLDALQVGACGSISSNTRDCIEVGSSSSRFSIIGCSGGQMFAGTTPATRYGLSIAAGCDHYTVQGNRFEGNLTGGILNTPGRSSTRAVLNNIPDVTIAGGSGWGLQIDATSPAVPVEITGAEQGENLRVDTRQTVSVSGTQDIALNDDTTVLVLQLTADTTLRSLRTTATGDGRIIRIEHDSGAFTLTVAHNGATPTYLPFFNPNLADMQVTRGAIITARSRSGFWRPEHTGTRMRVRKNSTGTVFDRGRFNVIEGTGITLTVADDGPNDEVDITLASSVTGLTDGDKGDVTVSASGATWTVDTNIVKTWTGAHSFTGASHTVDTAGAITMEGDSDCSLASTLGGLALGAGHVVVSPSVDNLDVVINAKGGVGINAHATTPVTGAATGNIELTATADVVVSAGDQFDVTAEDGVILRASPVSATGGTVRFATGTTPSTPPAGQVVLAADNNTLPHLTYKTTALVERVGFAAKGIQTASGTQTNAITNITITSISPNANAWEAGTIYKLEGYFVYAHTAAATPTITLDLLVDGATVTSLVMTPVSVAASYGARVEARVVCRTTGVGGTAMCSLNCVNNFGATLSDSNCFSSLTGTSAMDTTGAVALLLRVRMTTAVASNTLTVIEGSASRLS
jgi:hypothetical protein